jgi:hypothetical protein
VMLTLSNCIITPPSFSFPFSSLTFKASIDMLPTPFCRLKCEFKVETMEE